MDLEVARADRRLDPVAVAAGLGERTRHGRLADAVEAEHPPAGGRRAREHRLNGLARDGRRPEPAQLARRAGHHDVDAALARRRRARAPCRRFPTTTAPVGHGRLLRDAGREVPVRPVEPLRDPPRDPLDARSRAPDRRAAALRRPVRRARPCGRRASGRGRRRRGRCRRPPRRGAPPRGRRGSSPTITIRSGDETERERLARVEGPVPVASARRARARCP